MPPAARGRVVVAANPFSGRGPNAQRVAMLAGALRLRGLEPCVVWEPVERAAALAGVEPGQTVIAVGGDGTVAAVINELPPGATLAVLPAGNENLFARALGFPADPVALAGGVAAGVTRALDLGRATATAGGRTRTRLFSPPLTVSANDGTLVAVWCVVSNIPAYALGLRLVDGGRPDDGRLDWLACERRGLPALARYAWAAPGALRVITWRPLT
ncbi:MAG TPA: diacylglycerol kinase family protein [Candidatus Limnocylindria bacterium]|nr:diacylglycerol kinase family protein [Candidatus Limnocylindria bacterium]